MFGTKAIDKHNNTRVSSTRKHALPDRSPKTRQPGDMPGAHHFFQRNLGNSLMQSMVQGLMLSEGRKDNSRLSTTGGAFPRTGSSSCCSGKNAPDGKIQTKLAVGPANDIYEQEADRVARQVMRMPDSAVDYDPHHCDKGIKIRRLSDHSGGAEHTDPGIRINPSGGRHLSDTTRRFMEPRFGVSFGHVRLHEDRSAHQVASQIQAKAFTVGNHIWLGKDANESRRSLMAHELTHVIQQQGAVTGDPVIRRTVVVNPNAAAASDILGQFRTMCSDVTFNRSGQTITADSSSVASQSCECLSDTVGDPDRTYTINVDTAANSPRNVTLYDGTTISIPYPSSGPRTRGGTNPMIYMPSSTGSSIEFGAFAPAGNAIWPPNWRILAHELCGHGRLNQSYPGSKGNRPGHNATIDTENTIAGEHGEPARGEFRDPRQGESFHNAAGNRSMIAFMLRDGWHYEAP